MQSAKRSAFVAKMNYYDYVVMQGVIGRLQARGYEMNYDEIYSYLTGKQVEKNRVYLIQQAQYANAKTRYNNALKVSKAYKDLSTKASNFTHLSWKGIISSAKSKIQEKAKQRNYYLANTAMYGDPLFSEAQGTPVPKYRMSIAPVQKHKSTKERLKQAGKTILGFDIDLGNTIMHLSTKGVEYGVFAFTPLIGLYGTTYRGLEHGIDPLGSFSWTQRRFDNWFDLWDGTRTNWNEMSIGAKRIVGIEVKDDTIGLGGEVAGCLIPGFETICDATYALEGKDINGNQLSTSDRLISLGFTLVPAVGGSKIITKGDDIIDGIKTSRKIDNIDEVYDVTKNSPVLGKGSTGRIEPRNLKEQLAMLEVRSDPLANAEKLNIKLNDSRWPSTRAVQFWR